jgi:nucleotide-binding universal stress UspA family protein
MEKILVAIDFSDLSGKVLETAIKMAKKLDAKLYVLHTEPEDPSEMDMNMTGPNLGGNPSVGLGYNSGTSPAIVKFNDKGKDAISEMDAIKEHIFEQGIESDYMILDGNLEVNMKREAEYSNADMIIVGSHKHGKIGQLFFGEIGMSFVTQCPCPVLVVPEGAK